MRSSIIKEGDKYNHLTAVKPAGYKTWGRTSPKKYAQWLFKCDCGSVKTLVVFTVKNGNTKSCGCLCVPKGVAAFNLLFYGYKTNALKKGRDFTLTRENFKKLTKQNCYYCDAPPIQTVKRKKLKGNYLHNGIDRVDNALGYIQGNVVPCCGFCNKAKLNNSLEAFRSWVQRVHKKLCQA